MDRFANWLERHFEEDDERVLTSTLSVLLHREGINNRYLGVVRIHCRNPRLRHFLLRYISSFPSFSFLPSYISRALLCGM